MSESQRDPILRLCHLICPGRMGGAEKVVLAGCQALREAGVELELGIIRESRLPDMANAFADEARERGVPIHDQLTATKRIDVPLYRQLRDYLRTRQFNVLHTHGYKSLLYGARAKSSRTRLVHTHHGDTAHRLTVRFYAWLALQQMKTADAVCAVSEEMQASMGRRGVPGTRIKLVENMLAATIDEVVVANRKPHPEPGERVELVVVGRLSREKGIVLLLEAIAKMKPPRPHLTLVGEGLQREEIEAAVLQYDLSRDVNFAGFQKDILPFLAKADALAMPSLREGFPMTLIEAGAWGLPVLASSVGGIPSMIEHGVNGLLFPPDDVGAIRDALVQFVDNPKVYQQNAQNMAASIRDRFSPETWAQNMLSVYKSLV